MYMKYFETVFLILFVPLLCWLINLVSCASFPPVETR